MRYFVKFGYEGFRFSGFQRGNGDNSVEDSILRALVKNDIHSDIRCAARTDRDVSALENVFAIDTDKPPEAVLGMLNSTCDGIFFTSFAMVPKNANPRHCLRKTYSYYLRDVGNLDLLEDQILKFQGTHDFRNFSRSDARNPVRTIDRIWMERISAREISVNFTARSFIWMQIRNIVGFSLESMNLGFIREPFPDTAWSRKPASPVPLILKSIEYEGLEFPKIHFRSILRHYQRDRDRRWATFMISDAIADFL